MRKYVMNNKFLVLAVYNTEKNRGILHTFKYQQKMEKLQEEFDNHIKSHYKGK